MADKKENIKIFNHTQELIGKNKTLQDSVKYSVENSDFYADNMTRDFFCENRTTGIVKVTWNSSFNAARNYTGKVAVLNFASATNPGGGVTKGSNAQEECLCNSLNATFKSMETGVELTFQEIKKSDAGKLADRFTELLKNQ